MQIEGPTKAFLVTIVSMLDWPLQRMVFPIKMSLRHPGLKLKIPAWVFCMSWCNLTLSSGGRTAARWPCRPRWTRR